MRVPTYDTNHFNFALPCDILAIDTDPSSTYCVPLNGSPLILGVRQEGTRCESGAAPQR